MVVPPRYFYLLLLLAVCAGFGANDSRRSSSFSFGFYPLSSQKNSFHSFQNVTKTRALFDGTPSIIMLRAGGVQTQMTTTMNKVLSSCVYSSSSSTSSNLMATRGPFAATATTRPTWHRCGRHHHHHHHHHHRARDGKTMFSTGLERTMCTKAASSSNDTNNNKTTTTTTPQEQWKASIDFKAIRENQKHVERNCANRNVAVDVSAGRNLMTFLRDATHRI